MERKSLDDRQLDALLERLDRLTAEVRQLNRRLDSGENLAPVVHELRVLNESLSALAYAALGRAGPQVRRRRAS
jgi:DNA-binding FrmR family transcriptional regulator